MQITAMVECWWLRNLPKCPSSRSSKSTAIWYSQAWWAPATNLYPSRRCAPPPLEFSPPASSPVPGTPPRREYAPLLPTHFLFGWAFVQSRSARTDTRFGRYCIFVGGGAQSQTNHLGWSAPSFYCIVPLLPKSAWTLSQWTHLFPACTLNCPHRLQLLFYQQSLGLVPEDSWSWIVRMFGQHDTTKGWVASRGC